MSNNSNYNPHLQDDRSNIQADGSPEKSGKQAVHTRKLSFSDMKAYLDGELSAPRRWIARAHLTRCAACREEILGLKRVSEDIKNLPQATPRPELRRRILASLPEAPPQHSGQTHSWLNNRLTRMSQALYPAKWRMNSVWPGRLALSGSGLALLLLTAFALNGHGLFHPASNVAALPPTLQSQTDPRTTDTSDSGGASSPSLDHHDMASINTVLHPPIEDPGIDTDPISKEATALANKREAQARKQETAQHRQKERQERRQVVDARQHAPAVSFNTSVPKAALALTIPDITVAVNHLSEVAQHLGGTIVLANAPTSLTSPHETTTYHPGNIGEMVVLIKVPAARVADFESGLRQMGNLEKLTLPTLSPLPPSETSAEKNAPANAHNQKVPSNGEPLPVAKPAITGDNNPQTSQQFTTYEIRLRHAEHGK